jgi:hypothetical protein
MTGTNFNSGPNPGRPVRAVEEPLWRAMWAADGPASITELQARTRSRRGGIQLRLARWVAAGLVTRVAAEPLRFAIAPGVAREPLPPRPGDAGPRQARSARDTLWAALCASPAPVTVIDLRARTGGDRTVILRQLTRWVAAGRVTRIAGQPVRFAIADAAERAAQPPQVNATGAARPRLRTAREKLWSAMRVLREFDLPTLTMTSGASRRSAEELINVLHRAGHLRQLVRGNPTTGVWSTYRLVRNSGPKAPIVRHRLAANGRLRELVDGNTGRCFDISPRATSLRKRRSATVADGGVG